jgi:outer membrane protein OmpA-like peptidoglycan-associated protein
MINRMNTMNHSYFSHLRLRAVASALLVCVGSLTGLDSNAQTVLTPANDRITDEAQRADHAVYAQMQERIHAINETGVPVRNYYLSKAQCWLDVSFHEYTRNDRSAFVQESLNESAKLIVALEGKQNPISNDTPLVNGAARIRPDLWERAGALHGHAGFACAQQRVACSEVELVHAGNELNQQQWRHAKPYVQIAEDDLADADALAASCPTPAPQLVSAPVPPAPVVAPEMVRLSAQVVFEFDRFGRTDIRAASLASLEQLLARLNTDALEVQNLVLVGHADRLNSTGNHDYNQTLSQKRVMTVRDLLLSRGVVAARVQTDFKGDTQPVDDCTERFAHEDELKECLLSNRRVDIRIEGLSRKK